MAATARAWQHPRWHYDEQRSEAAQRSAARTAARQGSQSAVDDHVRVSPAPQSSPKGSRKAVPAKGTAAPARQYAGIAAVGPVVGVRPRFLRVASLIVLAGAVLLAPVTLNMATARTEYAFARLEERKDQLEAERSSLQAKVSALESHQRVGEVAQRLGMVPGLKFAYLDLVDRSASDTVTADGVKPAAGQ